MNRKIIEKILDALNKDNVDISYIRGILETLYESLPEEKKEPDLSKMFPTTGTPFYPNTIAKIDATNIDEGAMLDNEAKAKMASIKKIADESITNG